MKKFNFDPDKAKAAMLYISNKLGEVGFLKIFKILYFADQKHLSKYGRPVVGDTYIAMRNGPVPSLIYDCLKALRGDGIYIDNLKHFYDGFEIKGKYNILSKELPDMDELSPSDINCLDESIRENKGLNFGELSDKSHDNAWRSAAADDTMNILNIAKAGGANDEMMKYIKETLDYQNLQVC